MKKVMLVLLVLATTANVCLANTDWEGKYIVRSTHYDFSEVTMSYVDNFEMTIEKIGEDFYITSFLGNALNSYYDNGFLLEIIDDGIAMVDINKYSVIRNEDKEHPLYRLLPMDPKTADILTEWNFSMDADGNIEIGDFTIAAYNWSEDNGYWIFSGSEVWYTKMFAVKNLNLLDWSGVFSVSSSHIEYVTSMEYNDNFEMTIENINGFYYITSLFGRDLKEQNYGGLKILDNGDGTATVNALMDTEIGIIRYDDDHIYFMEVWDRSALDFKDHWTLTMNQDGSISLEDFDVVSFIWDPWKATWTSGELEASYYNLLAVKKQEQTSIDTVNKPRYEYKLIGRDIILNGPKDIVIYNANGTVYFKGITDKVNNVPSGVYIINVGKISQKIFIR